MRFTNADAAIVVTLSGRVTYWIFGIIELNVAGIVVIVLVLLNMMVLKDGQEMALTFRYDTLDTSRCSVVNRDILFNTPYTLIDVMECEIVMEDIFEPLNVPGRMVVRVLLRDKSKEPVMVLQSKNT